MKFLRILTTLTLSLLMLAGPVVSAQAAAPKTIEIQMTYINPLYKDILTEDDLVKSTHSRPDASPCADPEYTTSVQEAGKTMRAAMKKRQASVTLYFQNSGATVEDAVADMENKLYEITDIALEHTGEPTEGDYLMWQFGGWEIPEDGGSAYYEETDFYWTLPINITYYTTAAEENQVDIAVEDVLDQLDVYNASDYKKVKAIYDYICENVTYDYDHLNDTSYKHQFTAYGGLIDGTCVCQGYAVLFYRLALELDVDARLIPGVSHGENHGWNIVELDNLYYHADSTWDAGQSQYSYFLKGKSFPDHSRDPEYDSSAFHAEYPMATSDYVYNPAQDCDHSYTGTVTTEPGCLTEGVRTYTCTICGDSYTESIPATGHSFGEWAVTTAPTCVQMGQETRTCDTCGASEIRDVNATGHNYEVTETDASCTEEGITTYTCAVCGDSYTETTPATGHTYGDWSVTTAPTCTETGIETRTCACGEAETRTIEATGHSWDDGVIQQEPTETEDGIRLFTCEVCGETKTEPIPSNPSVYRVYGEGRYKTALKAADMLKETLGVEKFDTIVVACGTDFADALSGSYLANKKNAPILLVHKNSVDYVADYIAENLTDDGLVYILGGEGAVPASLDEALEAASIDVKRLAGSGRYDTNLLILEEAGVENEDILICTGKNFADCLSASATGLPILLTNNIALKDSQKEFLDSLNGNKLYIIGGDGVVSEEIANEIGTHTRISGSGRYETSILVANTFFDFPSKAVLAYGGNFPDGLCGGPLAYAMNAPLILTRDTTSSYAIDYAEENGITSGVVLGGSSLIGDGTVKAIFQMDDSAPILEK